MGSDMSQQDQERIWSDFRVGLIAFIAILFLILGVMFAGGDKGLIFKKTSAVKARLADIGGLKKGGSVTMSGMTIGKVTQMTFIDGSDGKGVSPSNGNQIEVTMEIRSDLRNKIKTDSTPAVRTQGMLGDRYIDIPLGTEEAEALPDGKVLIGAAATDFDKTLNQALQVLTETEKMLSAINEQRGTAGKLVYDEQFYNQLTDITAELDGLVKDFKKNPRRYIKFSLF